MGRCFGDRCSWVRDGCCFLCHLIKRIFADVILVTHVLLAGLNGVFYKDFKILLEWGELIGLKFLEILDFFFILILKQHFTVAIKQWIFIIILIVGEILVIEEIIALLWEVLLLFVRGGFFVVKFYVNVFVIVMVAGSKLFVQELYFLHNFSLLVGIYTMLKAHHSFDLL